jgi:hypothetical protein
LSRFAEHPVNGTSAATAIAANTTSGDGEISDNMITFGNGNDDYVLTRDLNSNFIRFGDGAADSVTAQSSSDNTIILGKGNNDSVLLEALLGVGTGGDTIITGTGNSNAVQVGTHTSPDTFGFALGTGATALSQTRREQFFSPNPVTGHLQRVRSPMRSPPLPKRVQQPPHV